MIKNKKRFVLFLAATFTLLVALYFIIGFIFFHFALNANNTQSREIGEKQYIPSEAIDDQQEQAAREKDRGYLQNIVPEEHAITSHDGLNLKAYEFKQPVETNEWIFAVHGYTGSVRQMTRWNRNLYELGYNIFAPDLRGHGTSDGDYYGMGWLDQPDLLQWIGLLVEKYPDAKITLFGVSMGASAVLNLSSLDLPDQVDSIISDSAYTSVQSIFSTQLKSILNLPNFPIMNAANTVSKLKIHLDFKEASTLDCVKQSRLPIFYIHGEDDSFVHVSNAYELVEHTKSPSNLWIVPFANHGDAIKMDSEAYKEVVQGFIQTWR